MKKILVVAAHPDDEVLGCGGTIAKLSHEGHEVFLLILGEGITSRDGNRNPKKREKEIQTLKENVYKAGKILGIKEIFLYNFPDNRFDSVDFLDIVKTIEKVKNEIKPQIIFTHSKADLNIDHRLTYKAVITATRPMGKESVEEIYSFEILSSTEWNYPQSFSPNLYINIEEFIEKKLEAFKVYQSEIREFPHPRSIEGIKIKASLRGMEVGLIYAEAFEIVRKITR